MIDALLDTHSLLWVLAGDERVPPWLGADVVRDPARFAVSDVSFWEIAIKCSTGRLRAPDDLPDVVAELGFGQASITRTQVWGVRGLPMHHRDPFDRLLVSQAIDLALPLVTADVDISRYDVAVLW